ncbi:hypothetical protein LEP1GSC050_1850 [Leptospira broomii serovar Hurstbridge str. 5399]|uniref:Uncharacterized protein n=1 Tax=Leptospira broomii serovar Hurstbridge str. 5399 TaxID=1049789 RepID=T0F8H8_9LEPT|nr:hypothetical protein [Leptospira broomii]EQA43812.1 hypothetical protein LEP1GSC050_1850 [Leptospira broomii serovar Hurstbridge str. 5399]
MKFFIKTNLLFALILLPALPLILSIILLSQKSQSSLSIEEETEELELSSLTPRETESTKAENRDFFSSDKVSELAKMTLVKIPFAHLSLSGMRDNLEDNIFKPNPDPTRIEEIKSFHEKLDYLEGKERAVGLTLFEEEEFISLQLKKKKDLREVLKNSYEQFKEGLSEEQRKEFNLQIQSIDDSILKLSNKASRSE